MLSLFIVLSVVQTANNSNANIFIHVYFSFGSYSTSFGFGVVLQECVEFYMSACSYCIHNVQRVCVYARATNEIRFAYFDHSSTTLKPFNVKHGVTLVAPEKKYKLHRFKNHIHMRQLIVKMVNVLRFNSKINYTIVAAAVTVLASFQSFFASLHPIWTIESSSVTPNVFL